MTFSADLAEKSVQAAIAAIEIYNKPNFSVSRRSVCSSDDKRLGAYAQSEMGR